MKWPQTPLLGIVILNQLPIAMDLGIDVMSLKATTNIILLSFQQSVVTTQQTCNSFWTA
jgi:hypothetical protein